MQVWS